MTNIIMLIAHHHHGGGGPLPIVPFTTVLIWLTAAAVAWWSAYKIGTRPDETAVMIIGTLVTAIAATACSVGFILNLVYWASGDGK